MRVCAAPGLQCPKEGKPREYISDDPRGVEVADSSYYKRLVGDGSLLEVKAAAEPAPAAAAQVAAGAAVPQAAPAGPAAGAATPAAAVSATDKKEGGDQ